MRSRWHVSEGQETIQSDLFDEALAKDDVLIVGPDARPDVVIVPRTCVTLGYRQRGASRPISVRPKIGLGARDPATRRSFRRPPEKVTECTDTLEKFPNRQRDDLPLLVKTALVHV